VPSNPHWELSFVLNDLYHAKPNVTIAKPIRKGRAGSNQESVEAAQLFTTPPLASVGLTELEAEKQGINYKVNYEEMTSWFSYKRLNEPVAAFKVLLNKDTDQIIGAHLLGHHAEEIINIFAVAMNGNITGSQLKKTIFSYPTNASDIVYML